MTQNPPNITLIEARTGSNFRECCLNFAFRETGREAEPVDGLEADQEVVLFWERAALALRLHLSIRNFGVCSHRRIR